jgi:hypothetical protein
LAKDSSTDFQAGRASPPPSCSRPKSVQNRGNAILYFQAGQKHPFLPSLILRQTKNTHFCHPLFYGRPKTRVFAILYFQGGQKHVFMPSLILRNGFVSLQTSPGF